MTGWRLYMIQYEKHMCENCEFKGEISKWLKVWSQRNNKCLNVLTGEVGWETKRFY